MAIKQRQWHERVSGESFVPVANGDSVICNTSHGAASLNQKLTEIEDTLDKTARINEAHRLVSEHASHQIVKFVSVPPATTLRDIFMGDSMAFYDTVSKKILYYDDFAYTSWSTNDTSIVWDNVMSEKPNCVTLYYRYDEPGLYRWTGDDMEPIELNFQVDYLIPITYAELKTLKTGSKLIPGMKYRITDYECKVNQTNVTSANHVFDIIVTAEDVNKLNENATVCLHDGDTYFANNNLSAWQIKYSFDNDTTKFTWANTNGKGVIYYMKDEFNNEAPYDFKNITFGTDFATLIIGSVVGIGEVHFTRDMKLDTANQFAWSINSGGTTYTIMTDLETPLVGTIVSNGVFTGTITDVPANYFVPMYTFGKMQDTSLTGSCNNNIIDATIVNSKYELVKNVFGLNCTDNKIAGNCKNNKFGNNCKSNSLYCGSNDLIFKTNDSFNVCGLNSENIITSRKLLDMPMTKVTYDDLVKLRDSQKLIPGMQYRIIDYKTTCVFANTNVLNNRFDVIVTADSNSTLNEYARVCKNDGSTYNLRFSQWSIKYNIDNVNWSSKTLASIKIDSDEDTIINEYYGPYVYNGHTYQAFGGPNTLGCALFDVTDLSEIHEGDVPAYMYFYGSWDTGSSHIAEVLNFAYTPGDGKGIITWMKDEFNNEAYFDFKNIQFKAYKITGCDDNVSVVNSYCMTNTFNKVTVNSSSTWLNAITGSNNVIKSSGLPFICISGNNNTVDTNCSNIYIKGNNNSIGADSDTIILESCEKCVLYNKNTLCAIANSKHLNIGDLNSYLFLNYSEHCTIGCKNGNTASIIRFYLCFDSQIDDGNIGINIKGQAGSECRNIKIGNFNKDIIITRCDIVDIRDRNETFDLNLCDRIYVNSANKNITIDHSHSVTVGNSCLRINVNNESENIRMDDLVQDIVIPTGHLITLGSGCYSITLGRECWNVTFGAACYNITTGFHCSANVYHNRCSVNLIDSAGDPLGYTQYCEFETDAHGTFQLDMVPDGDNTIHCIHILNGIVLDPSKQDVPMQLRVLKSTSDPTNGYDLQIKQGYPTYIYKDCTGITRAVMSHRLFALIP